MNEIQLTSFHIFDFTMYVCMFMPYLSLLFIKRQVISSLKIVSCSASVEKRVENFTVPGMTIQKEILPQHTEGRPLSHCGKVFCISDYTEFLFGQQTQT